MSAAEYMAECTYGYVLYMNHGEKQIVDISLCSCYMTFSNGFMVTCDNDICHVRTCIHTYIDAYIHTYMHTCGRAVFVNASWGYWSECTNTILNDINSL